MITTEQIRKALCDTLAVAHLDDGVRISTHCLYPSNDAVTVVVRGGKDTFVVSDDGGALEQINSSGLFFPRAEFALKRMVKNQGLNSSGGAIFSPQVPFHALAPAIMIVANASKMAAEWGISNIKAYRPRNFRKDLSELLEKHFHDNLKNDLPVAGASNKAHKFTHVIFLSGERRLLIDPAVNDASSINARVVANLDVKMANNPLIKQVIVYDDHLKWSASDLRLLEVGAPILPFSRAEQEIERIAA